jgi:hypothetical protein
MKLPLLALASAIVLSGLATAQTTIVSPKVFEKVDGPYSGYYPFYPNSSATYRYRDYMEIHDLSSAAKGKLNSLKWRREGTYTGSTYQSPSPVFWADMEVSLSSAAVSSKTMVSTFATNHGKNKVVTFKRKKVNFKSYPYIPKVPSQPFFVTLPFDSGSQLVHAGGAVAVQAEVHDNNLYDTTSSTYRYMYLDHAYNTTYSSSSNGGRGCYGSDETNIYPFIGYAYASYETAQDRFRYYASSSYGLVGGVGINLMCAGLLPQSVPLPGACYLHVDLSTVLMAIPGSGVRGTSSSNYYYYPPYTTTLQYIFFPYSPTLAGTVLYAQSIGVDPKANSMGLTLSNWSRTNFPAYQKNGLGVSYGYGYNSGSNKYYYRSLDRGNVTSFTFN